MENFIYWGGVCGSTMSQNMSPIYSEVSSLSGLAKRDTTAPKNKKILGRFQQKRHMNLQNQFIVNNEYPRIS